MLPVYLWQEWLFKGREPNKRYLYEVGSFQDKFSNTEVYYYQISYPLKKGHAVNQLILEGFRVYQVSYLIQGLEEYTTFLVILYVIFQY